MRGLSTIVAALFAALALAYAPEDASREVRFADPPASARLLPIYHGWSNDAGCQTEGLDRLTRQGFGGFVGNVRFEDGYLDSQANLDGFRTLVAAAKTRGLRVWLYDEPGYPSGTAGGRVTRGHPEREACGYLFSAVDVAAGASAELALPPGRLVAAAAWRLSDGRLAGARRPVEVPPGATSLLWTAPNEDGARWKLVAWSVSGLYEGTHAAVNISSRIPYVNLMSAETTDAFLASTHEVYARMFGGDLSAFDAFFTDEPSLMSLWMRPRPWSVLPYAEELAEAWRARTGRDLDADAPVLAFGAREENMKALRYAYWDEVGRLVSGNYMQRIATWARRHGTQGGGHLLLEEWTGVHLPLYGDFFRCLRALGSPGVDMLTSVPREVSPQTACLAGSAGALNGARQVMCEVSDHVQRHDRKPAYQVTEQEIAGTLNILLWGGVNTFTSYYDWAPFSDAQIQRINLRVGRANTLLNEGREAVDVALLYPADTMKTDYDARPRSWCEVSGQAFLAVCSMQSAAKALFAGNWTWMFTDADSLGREDLSWQAIVLPGVDTLPLAAMRRLHAFWAAGGLVVAFGTLPVNSEHDFPSDEVRALSRAMFGALDVPNEGLVRTNAAGGLALAYPASRTEELSALLEPHLERAVVVAEGDDASVLRTAHRRARTGDVFFVVNDAPTAWRGRLRLRGGGLAERWDPQTGDRAPFTVSADGWGEVGLPAYGAMLFTTAESAVARRIRSVEQAQDTRKERCR